MQLVEVNSPQTIREFLDFPSRLYNKQQHPNWIRPLDNDIEATFDPKKNRNFANGKAIRWILQDKQKQTIGRVAAFVNDKTKNASYVPVGGMGFFECINDQQAAFMLFDACRNWLEAEGLQAMDGPINFGERDRFWGLLTEGFTEPNYGMFYHMPYYKDLFEAYGFQVYFKQYTGWRHTSSETLHPRIKEKARNFFNNPDYHFAHADKNNLEKLTTDFHTVYNKAWGKHAGVPEMSINQARAIVKSMKPVMDPKLLWFGYYKNEPVVFFIILPELNQIFKHLNGKLDLWGKLKFLWHKFWFERSKDKKMFGVLFGVVPEQQGQGLESAIIIAVEDTVKKKNYTSIEMNWIGDFNPKMLGVLRAIGAKICKTHVTYRKLFRDDIPFERYPIIK